MNSFRAVERALAYEAQRQAAIWEEKRITMGGPGGHKTTRGWDENAQITRPQRTKEESSDYRYFPEPDLLPVTTTDQQVEAVRSALGELPAELRQRLEQTYGLTPYDAEVLVSQGRALVDYFEATARACGDAKAASNWIQQDVLRTLNEQQATIDAFPVAADALAHLIDLVRDGKLPGSRAREVLGEMIARGKSVEQAMESLGIEEVDTSELEELCRELLDQNPKIVAQVREGKLKAAGALIGQARKRNPNVNPADVQKICLAMIQGEPG